MSAQPILDPIDPFTEFKAKARQAWSRFAPLEAITTVPASRLVSFAGIQPGDKVLDVGCGTGVVAITARQQGAEVTGLDLTPPLLERARENGRIAGFTDIEWREGDAEALPFKTGQFDVVVSQYGHMFAPRAEVAIGEMLRVLRPGGKIAFSTWPPELPVGRMFALTGTYLPAVPGMTPPGKWGEPAFIRTQLGTAVRDLTFDHGTMVVPALSLPHYRSHMEETAGPIIRIVETLQGDPAGIARFRSELEDAVRPFYHDNAVHQGYLLTRATKA